MKLLSLDIAGFKSFANKTSLIFDEGVTAIIGPNGSGKSNIAEAIRWVLGEQSLKTVRGKQRTDVIFAGSSSARQKGVAAVTITLSNASGRLPVEAAEVAISRTLNRSGESEYLLNGDPVRLFDIQHILASAGLGAKSYAVISQGMVDQYLTATPAARRELFDEATGVRALQLKLTRAQAKLKQVALQLEQLQAVLDELTPRRTVLHRQVQRHEQRIVLQKQFNDAQTNYWHRAWHGYQHTLRELKARLQQSASDITQALQARQQAESSVIETAQTTDQHVALQRLQERLEAARQAQEADQARYNQHLQERQDLAASLQHIRTSRQEAEKQLAHAQASTAPDDFFTHLQSTLDLCQQLLTHLQQQQPIDQHQITNTLAHISTSQELITHTASGLTTNQAAWQHVAGPLQAVARLQALEQERRERLQAMPEPTPPSARLVDELTAQLAGSNSQQSTLTKARERLEEARRVEIIAEREASSTTATQQQVLQQLTDLEAEIRRERGTQLLGTIQEQPVTDTAAEVGDNREVQQLANQLAALGEIDPLALREYEEVHTRYQTLQQQLADATGAQANANQLVNSLQQSIAAQFQTQFVAIRESFREHFLLLFGGGTADLEIVEESPPISLDEADVSDHDQVTKLVSGVEITIQPPGKKPSHINLLSGGEKALTSLALLLAIVNVQQPPFVVLDEVDAALDEANSFRFAKMLQELREHTQCIVITHNRETMGQADVLYGITMQQSGISEIYSVRLADVQVGQSS